MYSAKLWWCYAIQAHIASIEEKRACQTKKFLVGRVKDLLQYHKNYLNYLCGEPVSDPNLVGI